MKALLIFLITLIFMGCTPIRNIHEDRLYITKKYIGDYMKQEEQYVRVFLGITKDVTKIVTTETYVFVPGHPKLNIPVGTKCYIKYIAESRPHHCKVWILYLTWDGTDDLIMIYQNIYTGQIY